MLNHPSHGAQYAATLLLAGLLGTAVSAWSGAEPPAAGRGERFKVADKDANGALSRAETAQCMPRLAGNFDAIDIDRDGQLTRAEIRTYFMDRRMSAANRASYSQARRQQRIEEAK